jgi:hypothetical protein
MAFRIFFGSKFWRYGIVVPSLAISVNDYFAGLIPVYGDTYRTGVATTNPKATATTAGATAATTSSAAAATEPIFNTDKLEVTWIVVNRLTGSKWRSSGSEFDGQKGDLVVLTDPYHPHCNIVRRIKGVGEEWVRDSDTHGNSFHMFLRKGFCYVDTPPDAITVLPAEPADAAKDAANKGITAIETPASKRFDSLEFGPVSRGLLVGPPLFVLWPIRKFGLYVKAPASVSSSPSAEEQTQMPPAVPAA